jgi:hypothetical protein
MTNWTSPIRANYAALPDDYTWSDAADFNANAVTDTGAKSVSGTEAIPVTTPYCGYEKAPSTPRRSDVSCYVENRP